MRNTMVSLYIYQLVNKLGGTVSKLEDEDDKRAEENGWKVIGL